MNHVERAARRSDADRENVELRRRLEEAEETLRAIRDGAVDAFVVGGADGSKRIYTLEGADRPYRLLVEQMQQGAVTLYEDGTIAYSNLRLATMLGVAHHDLGGVAFGKFIAPDDQTTYEALLRAGQAATGHGEVNMQRADGTRVPVYLTINVLPKDSGTATVGVLVTDLTLQKLHEHLAEAQKALRDADRRKDEFLATLAHELRGPLAPLANSLQIMKQVDVHHPTIEKVQSTMERQVRQMTRLVDDLLDVSRITHGQMELRPERLALGSVIDRAVEACRPALDKGMHELAVTLPKEPIYLDGDPVRLAQVFSNLLHNACKYSTPGSHISLTAKRQADAVLVSVQDTGVGIPRHMLSRIFEPFTQIDRTLEAAQGGLGIGLALVRRLTEMHGGSVEARSRGVGHGSEFVVRLPIVAQQPTPALEPHGETPGTMPPRRILVVDDNRDSADSLAMLLAISGHDVHTAYDGIQAVDAAAELQPEVILLDIGLPGLNGYEAARRIRAQRQNGNLTLVALTGWGQEQDRHRSAAAGFDAHMVKPVDAAALAKLLAQIPDAAR
jgi:PAS domain S-box-containing protein